MSAQIMIVDDEFGMITLLEIILKRAGYSTIAASNAAEAQYYLDREAPDAFIIDYMMPDVNGVELSRSIRHNPITTEKPIIMLTALKDDSARLNALEVGVDVFMTKPVMHNELVAQLGQLLSANMVA